MGDQVLTGGRLSALTDLRYRHNATHTMIPDNGRVAVAHRTVRVYRPRTDCPPRSRITGRLSACV
ncbi:MULTISPECIES: hypothetical protein [unclassified Streptomyces]|uniref:hypothetical protein n=1 Tax=unclassified Streptomyces TaxID=2593676 RepID=UPI002E3177CA|nr:MULTISPECIES: hypothetical protein [unclassified Streptomyces]WUC62842.1 hypothetical protein OG861_00705 [Streptomyces sp. NBC_00539]